MRRLPVFLAFLVAAPLFGGVSYRFTMTTTGPQSSTLSGRMESDGPRMRMDVEHGDALLFRDGTIALSDDGGKTMTVIDPAAKTFYVLKLDELLSGATATLKNLGSSVKFLNPQVNVRDGGSGGTIEGYPTQKSLLDAGYDVAVDMMGTKMTMHATMHVESWRSDKLQALVPPFQMQGTHTGIEALDKVTDAMASGSKGFPLKEIATVEMTNRSTAPVRTTTTSEVSHVEQRAIAATDFAVPAGLRQVPNPMESMLGSIRQ